MIPTPGPTRGYVSLLRDTDGLLLTADAFGGLRRRVRVGVLKPFCTDPAPARRPAEKLFGEHFTTVMFAYGSVLQPSGRAAPRDALDLCGQ